MRRLLVSAAAIGLVTTGFGLLVQASRNEARVNADEPRGLHFSTDLDKATPGRPFDRSVRTSRAQVVPLQSHPQARPAVHLINVMNSQWVKHSDTSKAVVPRVQLSISPDHHVSVIAAAHSEAADKKLLATGAIIVTAERFELTPPASGSSGNQIQCQGAVELQSQQFIASGGQLSILENELVLEGTTERPASLTKYSTIASTLAPIADPDLNSSAATNAPLFVEPAGGERTVQRSAPPTPFTPGSEVSPATSESVAKDKSANPLPEFTISANRISFTLALDRLQVGQGITVTPIPTTQPPAMLIVPQGIAPFGVVLPPGSAPIDSTLPAPIPPRRPTFDVSDPKQPTESKAGEAGDAGQFLAPPSPSAPVRPKVQTPTT